MGALNGITVVEFGQFVVVPFCTVLMADAGARVIKVEPLHGDAYRARKDGLPNGFSRQFLIKNRGKQSIALDLSSSDARPVIDELIHTADVVLVNLSPSATRRRGLDYESVRELNPSVIYAVVSAYGHRGPDAELPGMDVVVQARSGLLSSFGAQQDGVPMHSEVQAADYSSALLLFGAVCAALYSRTQTGHGQQVTGSLLGSALALQNNSIGHVHGQDDWRERFVTDDLPRLRAAGASREEIEELRAGRRPDPSHHTKHYRAFRTADGFVAVGAGSPASRQRLAQVLGLDPGLAEAEPDRFGNAVTTGLLEHDTAYWIRTLRESDVPVAAVRHVDELIFDEHALAEGLIRDYDHPVVGPYRALGTPFDMSGTPPEPGRPAPSLSEHAQEILDELGFTAEQIAALDAAGAVVLPPTNDTAKE
ncbi:hypothetical protein EK0264_06205 [Epidermidibacterium keratini]|uniref:CoA transferase n=1 Tax=Epidermidibacterium keratini TaxID=1891644 RepID=A0A7L4YN08_9ACTN|nr:CoA transferase [Epidermidibacterium keratini]QHB99916.1 hypothetical protein EK0264_06205 [Epidermidibacterium keratini]